MAISEKKLAYYERVADNTWSDECRKAITQLVDEVRKMEKEADWLAEKCAMLDDGISGLNATGYRELARRSAR